MNTKRELRENLESDIQDFLNAGHKITILRSKRMRVKYPARATEKKFLKEKPPSAHISNNFDMIKRSIK